MTAPVLAASEAKIAVDNVTMVPSLTLQTRGDRVLLVGDCEALLSAINATPLGNEPAHITGGSIALLGKDVARGEHRAVAGCAALDPPLPADWTVAEYLAWNVRLAGIRKKDVVAQVNSALSHLEIVPLARTTLRSLSTVKRRALQLAAATIGGPDVLVIESPVEALAEDDTAWLLERIMLATADRAAILSVGSISPTDVSGTLASGASDVLILREGQLVAHVGPGDLFGAARLFELTVRTGADELRDTLARRGLDLQGGPLHFSLRVPDGMTATDVLVAASEARAAVTSCVPLL